MIPWATSENRLAPHPDATRDAVVVFAASDPVEHRNGEGCIALDMGGCDLTLLNSGRAPLLRDHLRQHNGVIGGVVRAWTEGGQAFALVRFGRTPEAENALTLIRDGFGQNVSSAFTYDADDLMPIDGTGARICRRWRPFEISLVAVPASWRAMVLPALDGAEAMARHQASADAANAYRRFAHARTVASDFAAHAAPGVAARLGMRDVEAVREALAGEAVNYRLS